MDKRHAKCLCSAVEFDVDKSCVEVSSCHCNMCRNWSGAPMMSIHAQGDINFFGEENIGIYQSSDWAERGFCKICGTSLFYRIDGPQYYIPVGLFADQTDFTMKSQIFIDEKPEFYDFANETPKLTGKEVFDLYVKED